MLFTAPLYQALPECLFRASPGEWYHNSHNFGVLSDISSVYPGCLRTPMQITDGLQFRAQGATFGRPPFTSKPVAPRIGDCSPFLAAIPCLKVWLFSQINDQLLALKA